MKARKYANVACPICLRTLRKTDALQECDRCRQSFHAECWDQNGGCNNRACPNNPAASAPPESAASRESAEHTNKATPVCSDSTAALRNVPLDEHSGPPAGATVVPAPSRRIWWIPVALLGFTVLVVGLMTIVLAVYGRHERRAEKDFARLAAKAEAASPREAVELYQQYVNSHPDNELTRQAQVCRDQAESRIDDWDWAQASSTARNTGKNSAAAQEAYREYLSRQPEGQHAPAARHTLELIDRLLDDEAFARTLDVNSLDQKARLLGGYLDQFPDGRHVEEARASLASIPDEQEQERLQALLDEIEDARRLNRPAQAVGHIDNELASFRSAHRRDRLQALRRELFEVISGTEAQDILSSAMDTSEARARMLADAKLFLLRFPGCRAGEAVQSRLDELRATARADALQSLNMHLEHVTGPAEALGVIRSFLVSAGFPPAEEPWHQVIVAHFAELYRELVTTAPLPKLCKLFLTDDTVLTGELEERPNNVYAIRRPGEKRQFVRRDDVVEVQVLPATLAAKQCRDLLASRGLTPEVAAEALSLAKESGLENQLAAAYGYLSLLEPDNDEARAFLGKCDFVFMPFMGGWVPREDRVAIFGGREVNGVWLSPEREEWLDEWLAAHHSDILNLADAAAANLQPVYSIQILGLSQRVAMDCSLRGPNRPSILSVVSNEKGMEVLARFVLEVDLSPAARISDGQIMEEVRAGVSALASKSYFLLYLRVSKQVREQVGLGMMLTERGNTWRVDSLSRNGPAAQAGVEVGDVVAEIDGVPTTPGAGDVDMAARLRGAAGTEAVVGFTREGVPYELSLIRTTVADTVVQATYRIEHNLNESRMRVSEPWVDLAVSDR